MNTSRKNGNGNGHLRRHHRRIGTVLVALVLFLAVTGIVLNHSSDMGLDRRYVSWSWLLNAYGMGEPKPYAGKGTVGPLVVVGDATQVHVLLNSGELVETLDLGALLPGPIERVGQAGERAMLQSGGSLYRSDADVSAFDVWEEGAAVDVVWSTPVDPDAEGLEILQTAWRGQGLTVERVLLDLHSGRIFKLPGRLVLDLVGLGMIVLSITGLVLARRRSRKA